MQSLIIGGVIGGLAGFMTALRSAAISPSFFATDMTFFAYTVLLIGGAARVLGPVVGSIIFWFLITFLDIVLRPGDRGRRPAHPGLDHERTPGQPDALHLPGARPDAADDLPTTRDLRRPKGAGARCPLTPTTPDDRPRPTVDHDVDVSAARAALNDVAHEPGATKPDPILVADDIVRHVRRPDRRRRRARRDPARRHHRR